MSRLRLPTIAHKRPCRECPFRRICAKGWLGGGTVEDWVNDLSIGDTAFVCHMAEKKDKRHFCAGSMIFFRNSLKRPRDIGFAAAVSHYEPDMETVFQWPAEFEAHHSSGLLAIRKKDSGA
jgi:hypothetical protein